MGLERNRNAENLFESSGHRPPTPEEIAAYQNCMRGGFSLGIAFLIGAEVLKSIFKPKVVVDPNVAAPPNPPGIQAFLFRKFPTIIGSLFCGMAVCSVHCYGKMRDLYISNIKRETEHVKTGETPPVTEPTFIKEDEIGFQSGIDPAFDSSNYAPLDLSFDPSLSDSYNTNEIPELEDPADEESKKKKIPSTTYEELRQRNRESYSRNNPFDRYK